MDAEVNEVVESALDTSMQEVQKDVRDRIEHLMKIYPRMSKSMIQIVLGTSLPGKMWHPILDQLVEDGYCKRLVEHHQSPNGRLNSHTIYELVKKD